MRNCKYYNKYREEANRITLELIKKKNYDKEYFTLIREMLKPEFQEDHMQVEALIPTMLTKHYYEFVSLNPLKLKCFK